VFEGLERVRISSIEPTTIAAELFDYMTPEHKLCRYLHIPLQSGSDETLVEMKRKYTRSEFIDFIRKANVNVPQICIGTDVIVGFPGETDKSFDETVDLVREEPIHYVHVFSYSQRQMAKSNLRGDAVPSSVIAKRSQILRDLSLRKRRIFNEFLVGTTQLLLIEDSKGDNWIGITDNYVKVKVKKTSSTDLHNQILPATLQQVDGQGFTGEFV
jgi:threonylcarbamoyladenosine tRNA methylthiotransferase MtaB